MISGRDLQLARSKARLSRKSLGERLGVSEKTIYNWETEGVPPASEGLVASFVAEHTVDASNPLASISDVALLAELGRRLARTGGQSDAGQAEAQKNPDDGGATVTPIRPDDGDGDTAYRPIAARRGRSQGKNLRAELDKLGEENQDEGEQ